MAGETVITIIGNLTNDPELRFTPSGAAVANFTVASTPRTFDTETKQWKDGDPMFLRCSAWRSYAENITESLTKGMQVIVHGRLKQRSFETSGGEKRDVFEIDIDDVGPTLRFATAKVTKVTRASGSAGDSSGWRAAGGGGREHFQQQRTQGQTQRSKGGAGNDDDPWAQSASGGWGGGYSDEPPF